MQKPKAIIFDVGGVLRYSSKGVHYATKKSFESVGLNFPFSVNSLWKLRGFEAANESGRAAKFLMVLLQKGKGLDEVLDSENPDDIIEEFLKEEVDEEKLEKIKKSYKEIFSSPEVADMIEVDASIKVSIERLKNAGFVLGISTNAMKSTIERDLKDIGLENFSAIVGQDDIKNKKPHPEGILLACEKLAVNPKETVYVGDAASDIAAAKAAGCISVALLCGMGTEKVLRAAKPDFVFADLKEMVENILG